MITFEKWATEYDINELGGTGSGCSYNQLVSWSKPAWEACEAQYKELKDVDLHSAMERISDLDKHIGKLKQQLSEAESVIAFYGVADWNISVRQECGRLNLNDLYLDCGKMAREYQSKYQPGAATSKESGV